jgi:hypothetical protein
MLTAWKQLYKAAVLETNMDLVPRRVQEARKAAGERAMHLIREASDDEPESQDLVYARRVLDELNRKVSPLEIQNLNSPVCGIDPGGYTVGRGTQANSEMAPKMLDGYGLIRSIQHPWVPSLG